MTRLFGKYELVEELSRRNTVATLKCRADDGETVIVKVFDSPGATDRLRIANRAAALARLDHPGLARARGLEEDGDDVALVYDWVAGETVASMIERGVRFTDAQLFECMRQLLDALKHAHDRDPPVIHRDIKPQNVVWTGERFVLIDFDAAREVFADSGTASVVGTTGYAGPEQFVGSSEPRSDQYGIAATVLHMATHRHPTDFPLAGLHIDLSKTTLSIPMRRLLGRMLEPQVERRFDSVDDALQAVATEDGLEAWEVAMEPARAIDGVIEARRIDDVLEIEIGSRSSSIAWVFYAIAAVVLGIAAYFGQVVWQLAASPELMIIAYPIQLLFGLIAIYLGSRARQEYRARASATLRLSQDGWTLELPNQTVSGHGTMNIRSLGHSGAASTGGLTPISIREALAVDVDHNTHRFGDGLLPVEAAAIVDTVRAFQSPPAEAEFVFADFETNVDEDAAEQIAAPAARST